MVRIIIKGGVWKNTEDEVLKAAVMKYGKNQWARISSLLTRKTPKQCKARWFEWLDPSIKKMDWSRDEDEKLLHMAKLMPTQWRTIAPIVGRTPAQCLSRYQLLLDEAQGEKGISSDDVRKLRPGEIDPNPESKPARPDPVDMDEDEKEMLSEARARLANTQGKKAKRKAREKQLADARRISNLQKKRELKNAGIELKEKKKSKGMDYNADIPFHAPQPVGFFDTNEERVREIGEKRDLSNALMEQLEGKRRLEVELEERKKDYKKQKIRKEDEATMDKMSEAVVDPNLVTFRKKLILPTPQVTESDLEEIIKMGASGDHARQMVDTGPATPATNILGEYSGLRVQSAMRTPRMPTGSQIQDGDALKAMARNLKAMTTSQTPLLGEQVLLEGRMEFQPTPQRLGTSATPNPLVKDSLVSGATPTSRDQMGINTPRIGGFDETPQRKPINQRPLKSLFGSLSKPKNEFEIVLPVVDEQAIESKGMGMKDDMEVVLARKEEMNRKQLEDERKLESKVMTKKLPRPLIKVQGKLNESSSDRGKETVEYLIRKEVVWLMQRDAVKYPIAKQQPIPEPQKMERILAKDLKRAKSFIQEELVMKGEISAIKLGVDFQLVMNQPGIKISGKLNDQETQDQFNSYYERMQKIANQLSIREKKLLTTLYGYKKKRGMISENYVQQYNQMKKLWIEYQTFQKVKSNEIKFVEERIKNETNQVYKLSMIEQELQDEYVEKSRETEKR